MFRLTLCIFALFSFSTHRLMAQTNSEQDPFESCNSTWEIRPNLEFIGVPDTFRSLSELQRAHPNILVEVNHCVSADIINGYFKNKFATQAGEPYDLFLHGYKIAGYYYSYRYGWNNGGLDWDDCVETVIIDYRTHKVRSTEFRGCLRDTH